MHTGEIESHPLRPFLPPNARLLMLGSFPPPRKRWSMEFYYPNLQNDMWRIMGHLYYADRQHFLLPSGKAFDRDRLIAFLEEKGIALYDSASAVRRLAGNASDRFLEVVSPTDVPALLRHIPLCTHIATTGQKSMDTLLAQFPGAAEPRIGSFSEFPFEGRTMRLYRMPSTSRAYPLALEKKAAFYDLLLRDAGVRE